MSPNGLRTSESLVDIMHLLMRKPHVMQEIDILPHQNEPLLVFGVAQTLENKKAFPKRVGSLKKEELVVGLIT